MNQELIGKFIKDLREKNHLTQKEFALKYHVTFQAVSKWENGKNIPDISLLKQICDDYNVSLDEVLNGKKTIPKKHFKIFLFSFFIIIVLIIGFLFLWNHAHRFEFKTLTSTCSDFNISGNLAYSKKQSFLYLTHIDYCGGEDNTYYEKIECILSERKGNMSKVLDTYLYEENSPVLLEDFLKKVEFHLDDFSRYCSKYDNDSLVLEIKATDKNNKVTNYTIPLSLNDNCYSTHS